MYIQKKIYKTKTIFTRLCQLYLNKTEEGGEAHLKNLLSDAQVAQWLSIYFWLRS